MLRLYNSLSRKIEDFEPIHPPNVTMYTCGPTVYQFAHIGNFRSYTTADILVRTLKIDGFDVKFLMNITDVGHLTGDNLGDADTGEDKMEKSAKKEGKTAWEVAEYYTEAFLHDYGELHLTEPLTFAKATKHIREQIDLIRVLEDRGYTYRTSDGIYFNTSKFKRYGELSNLDQIKEGARIEVNPEKKNQRDFALWKFSYPDGKTFDENSRDMRDSGSHFAKATRDKRQMEWKSPWGLGFPGWHIECSAMSLRYLADAFENGHFHGERSRTIDIHTGGIDLRETHHPNEIAQSEAATNKKFVNYWVHTAHMLVQGEKMSKSLGNTYKLYDLEKEGFEPQALRYLYLQTHYRQEMNFTFPALEAAQNALRHLQEEVGKWVIGNRKWGMGEWESSEFGKRFIAAMNDDLNTPVALSVVWEMVKSDLDPAEKLQSLFSMDEIMGFGLQAYYEEQSKKAPQQIPDEVRQLVKQRDELRKQRHFSMADQLRNKIRKLGYDIEDSDNGTKIKAL